MGLLILGLVAAPAKQDPFGQQGAAGREVYPGKGKSRSPREIWTKAAKKLLRALEVGRFSGLSHRRGPTTQQPGGRGPGAGRPAEGRRALHPGLEIKTRDKSIGARPASTRPTWPRGPKGREVGGGGATPADGQDAARWSKSPPAQGMVLVLGPAFIWTSKITPGPRPRWRRPGGWPPPRSGKGAWAYQQRPALPGPGDAAAALASFQQALTGDRQVLDRAAMAADLFSLGKLISS